MRKRYVEKLSYYKLLEELNELPEECSTFPYYIEKIDDKKLQFVDFYVTFTRHYKFDEKPGDLADFYHQLHVNDGSAEGSFSVLFMYKSKNVRLSSQARFAFEVSFQDFELTQFIFNSKILTVSDFFRAALSDCAEYTQSLQKVQNSDNERFALIQT